MAFGFRKSKQFGPFRVSLSKSGLSASLGAKGARITAGPRGTYVTFSKDGFYYRKRLDKQPGAGNNIEWPPKQPPHMATPVPNAVGPSSIPPQGNESASQAIFGASTPDEFILNLNRRIMRRNYAIPLAVTVSLAVAALFFLTPMLTEISVLLSPTWWVSGVIGYAASLLIAVQHSRSRHIELFYDHCEETEMRLTAFHKAVSALRLSTQTWLVSDATSTTEVKLHPLVLKREPLSLDAFALPHIRTNIAPPAVQLGNGTLYFFPDRLFIWNGGGFATVDYNNLKVSARNLHFLERQIQPTDGAAVRGLRRSLTSTETLPVLLYGIVELEAAPTVRARIMTSRIASAQAFAGELQKALGRVETDGPSVDAAEVLYTHFEAGHWPLFYDLTQEEIRQAEAVRRAFALTTQSEYVWRYNGEQQIDDWKRNAGAGTLVKRTRIVPQLVDAIPGFETNAAVGVKLGNTTVYLLPDQCIAWTDNSCHAVGKEVSVQTKLCSFREDESVPQDAEVLGHTWRYVNKNGGPDLRFNNNRQIPILRYGQIVFSGEGPWRLDLCLSRAESVTTFEHLVRAAFGNRSSEGSTPPRPDQKRTDKRAAFRMLGLSDSASFEEASVAYRDLARRNHPDKVAHLAPEFRELAERRMRELNGAFEQIRLFFERR
jgi:hypothetical protein